MALELSFLLQGSLSAPFESTQWEARAAVAQAAPLAPATHYADH